MHEPYLVGVHEARIAHHVAAVGEIDRQYRAAPVQDGTGAMVVQFLVIVRADVAARKDFLQMLEESRIDRHHVFEMAVLRAILHHQDLAVSLDHLGLDLADLFIEQDLVGEFAVDDLLPDFGDAPGAQRIGLPGPAQGRLLFLIALEQRFVGPSRFERRVLFDLIEFVENNPSSTCGHGYGFLDVLDGLVHRG